MFARLLERPGECLENQKEEFFSLVDGNLCLHPSGFFIIRDSFQESVVDSNTLLFHGDILSFDGSFEKKEYTTNLDKGRIFLESIGLSSAQLSGGSRPLRRHSDTLFFPVLLQNQMPLYISPCLPEGEASSSNYVTTKVKEFLMTNCLFGSSILGVDEAGNKVPLIDHNLKVLDMIVKVELNDAAHPYEAMSFSAIQGLLPLLKRIGADDFVIRYHLPILDYMLYGIHLYINGTITFDVLEDFIEQIKKRGEKHRSIIFALAAKENINIQVESPFDNLFSEDIELSASKLLEQLSLSSVQIERMKEEDPTFARVLSRIAKRGGHKVQDFRFIIDILNVFDEFPLEVVYSVSDGGSAKSPRELFEDLCIENILDHLKTNDRCPEYQKVWQDIINGEEITRFSPFQQLFKVANLAFVARSRLLYGNEFEVCSLLPADEKPIAQAYKQLLAPKFGDILCLSWFPPILNYVEHEESNSTKHYKNNLFRLRPDLVKIDYDAMKSYLANYFGLSLDFWQIVDNVFLGNVAKDNLVIDNDQDIGLNTPAALWRFGQISPASSHALSAYP